MDDLGRPARSIATTTLEIATAPADAFAAVLESLQNAAGRHGTVFEPRVGAELRDTGDAVGRVAELQADERVVFELGPVGASRRIALTVVPRGDGAVVTCTQELPASLEDAPDDVAGWAAAELFAPLLAAATPSRFEEWLTDRRARRPSGAGAREAYRDPVPHLPNFGAILDWLAPGPEDRMLEVGCGGGVLLADVLRSGCTAGAIDHSPTMIALAGCAWRLPMPLICRSRRTVSRSRR
jgi:hypothetical protein